MVHCDVPQRFKDDRPVFCDRPVVVSTSRRYPVLGRPSGQPRMFTVHWHACAEHRAEVMAVYEALTMPLVRR